VEGVFGVGAAVKVVNKAGAEIARGLVNYDSEEIDRVKGLKTRDMQAVLGHKDFDEVIHRDNLVIL